jgi:hypothetical protein
MLSRTTGANTGGVYSGLITTTFCAHVGRRRIRDMASGNIRIATIAVDYHLLGARV